MAIKQEVNKNKNEVVETVQQLSFAVARWPLDLVQTLPKERKRREFF